MAGFAGAALDVLLDATAILDNSSTIVAVKRVWLMFALDNGAIRRLPGSVSIT